MLAQPAFAQTESLAAAVVHITIPRDQISTAMGPAIDEVMAAATAQGIGPVGPVFAHHFGMTPGIFNFEVGVPVSAPVQAIGRVKPGALPAATVMRTIFTGPYEGLGQAWGEFQDLVEADGHRLGPNLWESYLYGCESSDDASTYRTELNQVILL